MKNLVRWQSTRIDLFRDEGTFRVVRTLQVRTLRAHGGARVVSEEEVTPEEFAGEREGGFPDAFGVARRVSGAGEMARLRVFVRDRSGRRRMVNTYRVELGKPERERGFWG